MFSFEYFSEYKHLENLQYLNRVSGHLWLKRAWS